MELIANNPGEAQKLLIAIRPAAEITIKARATRVAFLRKLRLACKDALQRAGYSSQVWVRSNRVMAELSAKVADEELRQQPAIDALSRVFGVGSFSLLKDSCPADLEAIIATGSRLFHELVKGKRYAVRCKRAGKHPFSSMDVERRLGAALNAGATVDLTDPEVTVHVEIDEWRAQFFNQSWPGPGGMPAGTGGNALALLSGGYDSIVAAWHLMRRGVEVDFVHFRLGDGPSEEVALQVAKHLSDGWGAGTSPEAHVIDLRPAVDELRANVAPNMWQVSLKRLMVRAADGVADALAVREQETGRDGKGRRRSRRRVDALITGEALGQVSSQTLSNLRAIDAAAERPVLRPLIGFDKLDIIAIAERVGTAAMSAVAVEECNITPVRPAISSRAERLAFQEQGMNPDALEKALAPVVSGRSRLPLRSLRPGEGLLDSPIPQSSTVFGPVDVTELPAGAVLLDGRNEAIRDWEPNWPTLDLTSLKLEDGGGLDSSVTYVAFCPSGISSVQVANKLRASGIRAHSFAGGEKPLRSYLRKIARA